MFSETKTVLYCIKYHYFIRYKKQGDLRNSLILLGVHRFWHVAQWVSRAPSKHTLRAFLNLNGIYSLKIMYAWEFFVKVSRLYKNCHSTREKIYFLKSNCLEYFLARCRHGQIRRKLFNHIKWWFMTFQTVYWLSRDFEHFL